MNDETEMLGQQSNVSTRRLVLAGIVLLVLFTGYLYLAHVLSVAHKASIRDAEHTIRTNRWVIEHVPRRWRLWQPRHFDLIQHFFFYIPFGLIAGGAASLARQWRGMRAHHMMLIAVAGIGLLWALLQEIAQINLPDRSADFSDLFASWAGVFVGLGIYWIVCKIEQRKQHAMVPPPVAPKVTLGRE